MSFDLSDAVPLDPTESYMARVCESAAVPLAIREFFLRVIEHARTKFAVKVSAKHSLESYDAGYKTGWRDSKTARVA